MSSPLKDTWVPTVSGSYKAATPAQSLMVSNSSPRCWCHFPPWPEMCEVVIYVFVNSYFCPLISFRHSNGSIVVSHCSLKHDSLFLSTFYRCILSFRRFYVVTCQFKCFAHYFVGLGCYWTAELFIRFAFKFLVRCVYCEWFLSQARHFILSTMALKSSSFNLDEI